MNAQVRQEIGLVADNGIASMKARIGDPEQNSLAIEAGIAVQVMLLRFNLAGLTAENLVILLREIADQYEATLAIKEAA